MNITDSGVQSLAANCPRINHVSLFGNHITSVGVGALAEQCPFLQSMTLWASGVDANAMLALARHCRLLTLIELWSCPRITRASLQSLVDACRHLLEINIHGGIDKPNLETPTRRTKMPRYSEELTRMLGAPWPRGLSPRFPSGIARR